MGTLQIGSYSSTVNQAGYAATGDKKVDAFYSNMSSAVENQQWVEEVSRLDLQ